VLLVILFHIEPNPGDAPIITNGWIGVDLFFVISGFLITGILVDSEGRKHRLRNFFARRVLRIFPLYYLVLFVFFVVAPFFTTNPDILYADGDKAYYALYLQNLLLPLIEPGTGSSIYLSHTWSLAIEEQFYLVWPWLVILLPRRALIALLCLILVLAPIARFQLLAERPTAWYQYWLVYKNTLLHVDGLAVGSLLALIVRSNRVSERALKRTGIALTLLCLPIAWWVLSSLAARGVINYPYTPTDPVTGSSMFSFLSIGFGGLLAVILTLRSRSLDVVLCNPILTWIGSISYGLYVYHFPVILLLRTSEVHPLVSIAATFAVATLSWYCFEKPILRLKQRFC
jgi:peptidoglycan/LPS O-acetylase OafA/YrhL